MTLKLGRNLPIASYTLVNNPDYHVIYYNQFKFCQSYCKSAFEPSGPSVFLSMKRLGVWDGMLVHRRVIRIVRVKRRCPKIQCSAPAEAQARIARSGVQCTNHFATAPPTVLLCSRKKGPDHFEFLSDQSRIPELFFKNGCCLNLTLVY